MAHRAHEVLYTYKTFLDFIIVFQCECIIHRTRFSWTTVIIYDCFYTQQRKIINNSDDAHQRNTMRTHKT